MTKTKKTDEAAFTQGTAAEMEPRKSEEDKKGRERSKGNAKPKAGAKGAEEIRLLLAVWAAKVGGFDALEKIISEVKASPQEVKLQVAVWAAKIGSFEALERIVTELKEM